jgi:hypothetical protein
VVDKKIDLAAAPTPVAVVSMGAAVWEAATSPAEGWALGRAPAVSAIGKVRADSVADSQAVRQTAVS